MHALLFSALKSFEKVRLTLAETDPPGIMRGAWIGGAVKFMHR